MASFPISALIYFFNSAVTGLYVFKQWRVWRKNRNLYTLRFCLLALGASISFLFYATGGLIFPDNPKVLGFFYLLAMPPLILGLNEGIKAIFDSWSRPLWGHFITGLTTLGIFVFFAAHLTLALPVSVVESGVIRWNPESLYALIWTIFIAGEALPVGIFLLLTKVSSPGAAVKKTLLAMTFLLGGGGGMSIAPLSEGPYGVLLAAYLVMFAGFVFLAVLLAYD